MTVRTLEHGLFAAFIVSLAACGARHAPPPEVPEARGLPGYSTLETDDGHVIEYVEGGEGEHMILIHGFSSSIYTWRNVWDPLTEHFHVHAYDNLGIGDSNNPNGFDYGLEAHVAQLGALMDHRGIERAILVGNSMGAQIALAYASDHPQRVSGLVLIDPSGGSEAGETLVPTMKMVNQFSGRDHDDATRAFVRRVLEDVYFDDSLVTDEVVDRYAAQYETPEGRDAISFGLSFRLADPQVLYAQKVAAWMGATGNESGHRALLVWGAEDPWFPVAGVDDYTRWLPGVEVAVIEAAGHVPQAEKGPEVAGAIVDTFTGDRGLLQVQPASPQSLVDDLASEDDTTAIWAAFALASIGAEEGMEPVIALTRHDSAFVSHQAVRALEAYGPVAADPIVDALEQGDEGWTRYGDVVEVLGAHPSQRSASFLVTLLVGPYGAYDAVPALARMGDPATDLLLQTMESEDPLRVAHAVAALGGPGHVRALDSLGEVALEAEVDLATRAVESIGKIGTPRAVEILLDVARQREDIGYPLGSAIEAQDAEAVEPLVAAMGSADTGYLYRLLALARKISDPRLVDPTIEASSHEEPRIRVAAAHVLAAQDDERIDEVLVVLVGDDDPAVRKASMKAAGKAKAAGTTEAIIPHLASEDPATSAQAAMALRDIADPRALDPLMEVIVGGGDPQTVWYAVEAVGEIAGAGAGVDAQVVETLVGLLDDEIDEIRSAAVEALGKIGDASAVEALIPLLEDPSSRVQSRAIEALEEIGDPRATEPLLAVLALSLSWSVLDAIGACADARAVPPLLALLRDESVGSDRAQVSIALANVTGVWIPWERPDEWQAWWDARGEAG